MAGRVAPFIELGVGFNPELTARENVVLNGVLLGLSRREAARRLDAVLDFAELREFVDLKIKNYSSGMMVRLAFAIMVQADADIMLIDEVLAVGDAAFGQKCMDVFYERRRRPARRSCSSPTTWRRSRRCATARCCCTTASCSTSATPRRRRSRYYRLNFAGAEAEAATPTAPTPERPVGEPSSSTRRLVHARLLDAAGAADRRTLEQGAPIVLDVVLEAARELGRPDRSCSTCATPTAWSCSGSPASSSSARRRRSGSGCDGEIENRAGAGPLHARLLDPPGPRQRRDMAVQRCGCSSSSSTARRRARALGPSSPTCDPSSRSRGRRRRRARVGTGRRTTWSCATCRARRRSAAAGGARSDLLYMIAVTEFKQTYFGTALGYVWSLARPLLLFAVLVTVFTKVFHARERSPHYPVLLLMNIVLFGFFQEATVIAVGSVVGAGGDRAQDAVPAAGDPAGGRADQRCSTSCSTSSSWWSSCSASASPPMWTWLLFPVVLALLIVITIAVVDDRVVAVPALPRHRDHLDGRSRPRCSTRHRSSTRPTRRRPPDAAPTSSSLNPLPPIFELARKWIIDPSAPGPVAAAGGWLPAAARRWRSTSRICVFAVWIFNREAPRIAEQL